MEEESSIESRCSIRLYGGTSRAIVPISINLNFENKNNWDISCKVNSRGRWRYCTLLQQRWAHTVYANSRVLIRKTRITKVKKEVGRHGFSGTLVLSRGNKVLLTCFQIGQISSSSPYNPKNQWIKSNIGLDMTVSHFNPVNIHSLLLSQISFQTFSNNLEITY
jgi:hypothetical protein